MAKITWRQIIGIWLLATASCLPGCGGSDGTVPVSGDVKLASGEPLANADLQFYSSVGGVATSMTDAAGHFTISRDAQSDGLPPGDYVVVVKPPTQDNIDAPAPPPKFHLKYHGRSTTDLRATVTTDGAELEFVLDPPN